MAAPASNTSANGARHGAVLEFENEIEGIKINGVDIITFSDDSKITHFKVMVRPLKGINLLHRLMGSNSPSSETKAADVRCRLCRNGCPDISLTCSLPRTAGTG